MQHGAKSKPEKKLTAKQNRIQKMSDHNVCVLGKKFCIMSVKMNINSTNHNSVVFRGRGASLINNKSNTETNEQSAAERSRGAGVEQCAHQRQAEDRGERAKHKEWQTSYRKVKRFGMKGVTENNGKRRRKSEEGSTTRDKVDFPIGVWKE